MHLNEAGKGRRLAFLLLLRSERRFLLVFVVFHVKHDPFFGRAEKAGFSLPRSEEGLSFALSTRIDKGGEGKGFFSLTKSCVEAAFFRNSAKRYCNSQGIVL